MRDKRYRKVETNENNLQRESDKNDKGDLRQYIESNMGTADKKDREQKRERTNDIENNDRPHNVR